MSKAQKDILVQLIQSLTKAEKRHFKLYCRRNASGADPLFLQLFELIDRHKQYDEDQILERSEKMKKSQLPNLRSKLYKEILVALRLLHSSQNSEIAVRELLDFARLLYDKGLYRQSLNILDRARQRALELQMHALAMEIVFFEKHIESQHITHSIDTKADELTSRSEKLVELVAGETRFSNLSLQLYGLYLKTGFARTRGELNYVRAFFKTHLPRHNVAQLSFLEKLYLYQSYVWLYNITQEFPKQYRYAQKWIDLFHEEPRMIVHHTSLYLKGLHNLLNTLFLTMKYERFVEALDELAQFNLDGKYVLTRNEQALHWLFLYIHRLNRHFLEGSFTEGTQWVPELVGILESPDNHWDEHRNMVFYYKIACLYFGAGDNATAIEFLNRIINQASPNLREDIQSFARILNLIAHYELGNDSLVAHQLRSVYRFLLKMKELNETHTEILKFLRRTPGMTPDKVQDAFVALKQKLIKTQGRPQEMRSGFYLDIISWLESKIENRPVQEVIKEKFVRRRAAQMLEKE